MKKRYIAVCDDEAQDAIRLERYILQLYKDAVVTRFHEEESLIEEICENGLYFDLIFLAVNPSGTDGIQAARKLRLRKCRFPIVIVSESEAYYREAFDVFAFQYLLKPVHPDKLKQVFFLFKDEKTERCEKCVSFQYSSRVFTLRLCDIAYISSRLHSVIFNMKSGKVMHCRGKLNDFSEQLEGTSFVRCHQSFYVNMSEISDLRRNSVRIGDAMIPVSRTYMNHLQEAYQEYLNQQ